MLLTRNLGMGLEEVDRMFSGEGVAAIEQELDSKRDFIHHENTGTV